MKQVTTTLKIKFLDLNHAKAQLFEQMTVECTALANELLKLNIKERRKLTTAKVVTPLRSALANQVIRQVTGEAGKKTKNYKVLPPEVNNQNWELHKCGETRDAAKLPTVERREALRGALGETPRLHPLTYSVSFPTLKGTKRVPLSVAGNHWQPILDSLLAGNIQRGTLKLIKHRGKWYACLSVIQEVPEVYSTNRVGVDRGQNQIAVAATPQGKSLFFRGREVKHRRRKFQRLRHQLQKAGKYRAVKKLRRSETRWMSEVNHAISRRIAEFADKHDADVVLEDLSGCRQTMRQTKKSRADAGDSRHAWAYYDLELKIAYKLAALGRSVHIRPAAYTSKTSSYDGRLGRRDGHWFYAPSGERCNSDWNAARNIAMWDGRTCSLELQVLENGAFDNPHSIAVSQPEMGKCNSMNTAEGRVEWVQLSLFDCTSSWARQENPTTLTNEANA